MAAEVENVSHKIETTSSDEAEDVEMQSEEDDSSEDEESSSVKIQEIQDKVDDNPYIYDHQVELLTVLRNAGELEKLRHARNKMNEIFPLTSEFWLQWIEDESKIMESAEERDKVDELYNRALSDYSCPDIWLEYVQFSIGEMGRKGVQYPREVFEKALASIGLHITKGFAIWQAYREYELAVLSGLQPLPGSVPSAQQQEDIANQTKRIINLFKRELAVPLTALDSTFEEYKNFVEEEDEGVQKLYERTAMKLKVLLPFEEALEKAKPPKTEAYKEYIKHELKEGDPSRIQCIFERALIDNCLLPEFWIRYGKYLDLELRSRSAILKMYSRAIRNCHWSSDIWLLYLRALERFEYKDHDKIKAEYERCIISNNFTEGQDFLKVWTCYTDYMRRRIEWDQEDQNEKIEDLRNTFQNAVEYMWQNFDKEGDPNCTLLQYWARIEAKFCKNMEKARDCWNQIMQQGFGNQFQMWQEYVNLERAFGDHKHCRKIFQKALNSVTDWPEYVVEAFLNFEREEGTLEQLEQAMERCDAQMKRIEERKAKAMEKEARKQEDEKVRLQQKIKMGQQKQQQDRQFQRQQQQQNKQDTIREKDKVEPIAAEIKQDGGFKVPPPPRFKKPEVKPPPGFQPKKISKNPEMNPPPGFKAGQGNNQPPGYADDSEPPVKKLRVEGETPLLDMSSPKSDEEDTKVKNKVFVSNLSFDLKEADLTPVFSKYGELKDIRLVKKSGGKNRGFGYIEFKTEESAKAALALDRHPIEGRPMFVSECVKSNQERGKFRYATDMEKNKLFVKNLPYCVREDALKEMFSQHGKVKNVRLVTLKSGASKGIAYIEYDSEDAAAKAVLKTDGMTVGNQQISVAISNPPERKAPLKQRESTFQPSLGGGKKEVDRGGKARTLLAFQPRSLQSKKAPAKPSATQLTNELSSQSTDEASGDKKTGLSNADFRSMLLKK